MSFTRLLHTVQIGHEQWQVTKSFEFHSRSGMVVAVKKGFTTDMASIPAFAQSIVSKVGYWSQAAVVHDLLYRRHRDGLDDTVSRLQADQILREGCTVRANDFRVSKKKRRTQIIYRGVRAGGAASWYTPEETEAWKERQSTDNEVLE